MTLKLTSFVLDSSFYFLDSSFLAFPSASLIGAIIGSFSFCIAQRLINQDSLYRPSQCEACAQPLRIYQLIPLFSYLFQKGLCSTCRAPLSWAYPLSELFMMGLALVGLWRWGMAPDFFWYLALLPFLGIALFSDLLEYKIPDGASFMIGVLGLGKIILGCDYACLLSPPIAVGLIWSLKKMIEKVKSCPVLGNGDLILIGATSLWIAPLHLPYYFIAVGSTGTILSFMYHTPSQKSIFPFAPAIFFGMLSTWMIFGDTS